MWNLGNAKGENIAFFGHLVSRATRLVHADESFVFEVT